MVADTFDDLKQETPKARVKSGYWDDIEHRRTFLLNFAKEMGFDPMTLANWRRKSAKLQANEVKTCQFHNKYLF
jgi:hypothetical protein